MGFTQGQVDNCVFVKNTRKRRIFVAIYVDDVLVAAKDLSLVEEFKRKLAGEIEIRDMGEVKNFLGLQIRRGESWFSVNQEKLIADYAEKFKAVEMKEIRNLPPVESLDFGDDFLSREEATMYRSLVGGLLYIANQTRPDASFPVNFLSRFMQRPTRLHLRYAMKVLGYLYFTKEKKIYLGRLNDRGMEAYSDASFGNLEDYRSQSGSMVTIFGSPVLWTSRKQDNVSQSSTEAEYVALLATANEANWVKELLIEWGWTTNRPTQIYEDNQHVKRLAHNEQVNTRAKYLTVKLAALHDMIKRRQIEVKYVPSQDNWADVLTKSRGSGDDRFRFKKDSALGFRNRGGGVLSYALEFHSPKMRHTLQCLAFHPAGYID